jgi:hypothetical protein
MLKEELELADFHRLYGLHRTLSIGSTSQDLFAWLPVDHDIMVETELSQEHIERQVTQRMIERFAARLEKSPEFRFALGEKRSLRGIRLASLGVHGKASLVARLNAIWKEDNGPETEESLIDVTFGNARRTADYALWMQSYLARLPEDLRNRQKAEIRLAKRLFRMLGGVYSAAEAGLCPITIEQWVIQSMGRFASGRPIGTCDSLLRHIDTESGASAGDSGSRASIVPFTRFRRSFPVWRPGLTGEEVERREISPTTNLLELLGNGEEKMAQVKWERIVALARTYSLRRHHQEKWTLEELTGESRPPLDGACHV